MRVARHLPELKSGLGHGRTRRSDPRSVQPARELGGQRDGPLGGDPRGVGIAPRLEGVVGLPAAPLPGYAGFRAWQAPVPGQ